MDDEQKKKIVSADESVVASGGESEEKVEIRESSKNNFENIGEEKKRIQPGLIVILVLLLMAAVIGVFTYKYFSQNPTTIIKKVVNRAYDDFSDGLKEFKNKSGYENIYDGAFGVSGDVRFSDKNVKDLEKEKVQFDFKVDSEKELAQVYLGLDRDNSKWVDLSLYYQDDKSYMKSDTLFDNVYDQGESDFDSIFDFKEIEESFNSLSKFDVDDIDYITKEFKDALLDSLDDKAMTMSKENLEMGKKSIPVTKISYDINKESYRELKAKLADNVLNNDELIKKLALLTDESEKEVRKSFEELKKESSADDIEGEFIIYTTGIEHKVVKVELSDDEATCYLTIDDKESRMIYEDDSMNFEIVATEEKNSTVVEVTMYDEEIARFVIYSFDETIDLDYEITFPGYEAEGQLKMVVDEKDNKKIDCEISFDIEGSIDMNDFNFAVELNYSIEGALDLNKIDTKGALENMTTDDATKMMNKLNELGNSKIFSYLLNLPGNGAIDSF